MLCRGGAIGWGLGVAFSLAIVGLSAGPAAAATFTVSNLNNDGLGSLRQAIMDANASAAEPHVIEFGGAGSSGQINLASTLPLLQRDVEIRGPGADQLTVQRAAVSEFGIFSVQVDRTVTISGLTITNGYASGGGARGGAIDNNGGTLTVRDAVITGNRAVHYGGGIANVDIRGHLTLERTTISNNRVDTWGGGIASPAPLVIRDSVITGNLSLNAGGSGGGGGISADAETTITGSTISRNGASGGGGGIINLGDLTLEQSSVADNRSTRGGGIYNAGSGDLIVRHSGIERNAVEDGVLPADGGGISTGGGRTLIDSSTISSNSATGWAGGVFAAGASPPDVGVITIVNSTVSGNRTTYAVGTGGLSVQGQTLNLLNSTLAANENDPSASSGMPPRGANLALWNYDGIAEPTPARVRSTLIAGARGPDGTPSCSRSGATSLTSAGFNLDDDSSCGFDQPTDQPGVDPMLAPLGANGGLTQTHALPAASPAIDAGSAATGLAAVGTLSADQRGEPRPSDFADLPNASGGDGADVGAFERQAPAPPDDDGDGNGDGDAADNSVVLRILGKKLRLSPKRVTTIRLRCPAAEASPPCRGTLVVRTRRKVAALAAGGSRPAAKRKRHKLTAGQYSLGAGETEKLKLRLKQKKARLIRRSKKARKVLVKTRVADAAGNTSKFAKKAKLTPKKKRSKR